MKDIYKNPLFYYILVPAVVGLWPLVVGVFYLPAAEKALRDDLQYGQQARQKVERILTLDPDRLAKQTKPASDFEYYRAIEQVAKAVRIAPASYKLSSQPPHITQGKKVQTCRVELKGVSINQFAEFLSALQMRWPALQCRQIVLTAAKGTPDVWTVAVDFRYHF